MIYYNFGITLNHELCIENIKLALHVLIMMAGDLKML